MKVKYLSTFYISVKHTIHYGCMLSYDHTTSNCAASVHNSVNNDWSQ